MVITEDRAEILRSARLPQRTAAGAVALGPVLAAPPQAVPVAVSGQKGRRPVLRERTALGAGAVEVLRQA